MGIPFLWPHIQQEGHEATLLWGYPLTPLPSNAVFRIDVLSCFYSRIQQIFSASHDQHTCNTIFEHHLLSCHVPKTSILYIDGPSPNEKRTTNETRQAKRSLALQNAQTCLGNLETRVAGRQRVKKREFIQPYKNIRAAFYWPLMSRRSLALHLTNNGWNVLECPSEADVAIARVCQSDDIVVSGDSDMLIYNTIQTIWRPLSKGRFLVYMLAEVLKQLELSRAQLTTLGIVSKNDYTSNLTQLGISSNYEIIKSLDKTEDDVEKLILQYLNHPVVVRKNPSATHFDVAKKVFIQKECTVPNSIASSQTPNQGATAQDEEPNDVFNRYSTVDCPPKRRPRPHDPGRPYKHRQRFANKTRSQLKKHDSPENLKQYQLKPWKSPPESPLDPSVNALPPKATPKQQRLWDVATMEKKELVDAM
ncbi:hypothetical protein BGZ47_003424, partial [Haplosporangium gracile]